jgi:surface polysaccharide O-acyltransferase-like enzyme
MLGYVHNFRGLAILVIVALHCISAFRWREAPYLERALTILFSNGTVFFVFISGFLFQHLSPKFQYRTYLSRKFRFVMLPYFFVSMPAVAFFTLVMEREGMRVGFYDQSVITQMAEFLLTGKHLAPFWFIPTIGLIYLISPILLVLDRHPRLYWLLLVLLTYSVMSSNGSNPFEAFLHFLPIYVLGMFCSRHREMVLTYTAKYRLVVALAVGCLFAVEYGFAVSMYSPMNLMQKLILCFLLLYLMTKVSGWPGAFLSMAGTLSFGIFFVHSYLIAATKAAIVNFGEGGLPEANIFYFLAFLIVAFVLTIGLVRCGQHLTERHSRYLIGC